MTHELTKMFDQIMDQDHTKDITPKVNKPSCGVMLKSYEKAIKRLQNYCFDTNGENSISFKNAQYSIKSIAMLIQDLEEKVIIDWEGATRKKICEIENIANNTSLLLDVSEKLFKNWKEPLSDEEKQENYEFDSAKNRMKENSY